MGKSPAACATRAGSDFDPNFENFNLLYAQLPQRNHATGHLVLFGD